MFLNQMLSHTSGYELVVVVVVETKTVNKSK